MKNDSIGYRISQRRKDLCLTQEELAALMGYKTKSSINKIEKGHNDVPRSKVLKFAKVLHTTEAYLMGQTDFPLQTLQKPDLSILDTLRKLSSVIPTSQIALPNDLIHNYINNKKDENANEEDSTLEFEDIRKAFDLYKLYKKASPRDRSIVDSLLKPDKPDS